MFSNTKLIFKVFILLSFLILNSCHQNPQSSFEIGKHYLNNKKYDQAISVFEKLIFSEPHNKKYRLKMIDAQMGKSGIDARSVYHFIKNLQEVSKEKISSLTQKNKISELLNNLSLENKISEDQLNQAIYHSHILSKNFSSIKTKTFLKITLVYFFKTLNNLQKAKNDFKDFSLSKIRDRNIKRKFTYHLNQITRDLKEYKVLSLSFSNTNEEIKVLYRKLQSQIKRKLNTRSFILKVFSSIKEDQQMAVQFVNIESEFIKETLNKYLDSLNKEKYTQHINDLENNAVRSTTPPELIINTFTTTHKKTISKINHQIKNNQLISKDIYQKLLSSIERSIHEKDHSHLTCFFMDNFQDIKAISYHLEDQFIYNDFIQYTEKVIKVGKEFSTHIRTDLTKDSQENLKKDFRKLSLLLISSYNEKTRPHLESIISNMEFDIRNIKAMFKNQDFSNKGLQAEKILRNSLKQATEEINNSLFEVKNNNFH